MKRFCIVVAVLLCGCAQRSVKATNPAQAKPKVRRFVVCGKTEAEFTPVGWALYRSGVTRPFLIRCHVEKR